LQSASFAVYNYRMNNNKSLVLLLVLFVSGALVWAQKQSVVIELRAASMAAVEGVLVIPQGNTTEMLRTVSREQSSSDGNARAVAGGASGGASGGVVGTWTIERFVPGTYSFYVNDQFSDDDSGNETAWKADFVEVRVTRAGKTTSIKPKLAANGSAYTGRSWYVFDLNGSTGELSATNNVFPYRKMIYGFITDAVSGKGIGGVTVDLLGFADQVEASETTNASGLYVHFPSGPGNYTVRYTKKDLVSASRKVQYLIAEAPQRFDMVLTQRLKADQMRFVLSWGRFPQDLDAHLVGPATQGKTFHISYRDLKGYLGRYSLDRDDKDGYGPETITLNKPSPGSYVFLVHDFTNRSTKASTAFASSGAIVSVYKGDKLLTTFSAPEGTGNLWAVGSLNEFGEFVLVNTLTTQEKP